MILFLAHRDIVYVESKIWNQKCGITLIGRGDKPRDPCHSADYHTNLSTGKCQQWRQNPFCDHECNLQYL